MRLAFVFIAEAYQAYHLVAVALELRQREGVSVDVYYNDPNFPHHFRRIVDAWGTTTSEPRRLQRNWQARIIQSVGILGLAKKQVLQSNRAILGEYDLVVSPERDGALLLPGLSPLSAKIAYVAHGPAGRQVVSEPMVSQFDLVLLPGEEDVRRYNAHGYLHEGRYRATGYPKLETADQVRRASPPTFSSPRPIVLYNPHKIRNQSSWVRCIEPILKAFSRQDEFNLIVAPHFKMFHRRSQQVQDRWRARSTPHILIDLGSDRCLDNSYTAEANIYVGDVSSQVSEFLMTPRPCIFLNPYRIQWRGNPYFRFWELGEVVEDMHDFMPALQRATKLHSQFFDAQRAYISDSIRQMTGSAVKFTADSLLEYLQNGRIEP